MDRFSIDSVEDIEFIEDWYADIEQGFKSMGKTYSRPDDYIERALRVMNSSKKRNRILNQYEGKKGAHHENS